MDLKTIDKLVWDELEKRTESNTIIDKVRDIIKAWPRGRVAELKSYGDSSTQHDAIIRCAAILEYCYEPRCGERAA